MEKSALTSISEFVLKSECRGCPRDLLTVIDHLAHHNQQLKAEMAELQEEKQRGRELQLGELEKLQKCVSKIKKTQTRLTTQSHRSTQTSLGRNVCSVKSQTEASEPQQVIPVTVLHLPRHVLCVNEPPKDAPTISDLQSATSKTRSYPKDALTTSDLQSATSKTRSSPKDTLSRSEVSEVVTGVTDRRPLLVESKQTQTVGVTSLEDVEVPPQWLLSEALQREHGHLKSFKDGEAETLTSFKSKSTSEEPSDTVSKAVQVDTVRLKRKEKAIRLQDEAITVLMAKAEEIEREHQQQHEQAKRRLQHERRHHRGVQRVLEQKIVNICNIMLDTYGVHPDDVQSVGTTATTTVTPGDHEDDDDATETETDSDVDDAETGGTEATPSRVKVIMSSSRVTNDDVATLKDYLRTLLARLDKLHMSYGRAKHRLSEQEKDIKMKQYTQGVLEACVVKMKTEVQQLKAQLLSNSRTDKGGKIKDVQEKGGKQSENVRTQFLQGRLRDSNQQLQTKSKIVHELKQQLEESQKTVQNLKTRLSRSEAANHNKQTLVDTYKRQVQEVEMKLTSSANHNDCLSSEVRTLRECGTSMKKQIAQLEAELSERSERVDEWTHNKQRMDERVDYLLEQLEAKTSEAKKLESDTRTRIQKALVYYNLHISSAEEKVRRAGKRAKEFVNSLELFLQSVDQRRAASSGEPEARTLACSILNLTPAQLDSMSDVTQTQKPSSTVNEFRRIVGDDHFSKKLTQFLIEVVSKIK